MGGSGFAVNAINVLKNNRRLKRRTKAFEYWDLSYGKSSNQKHESQMTPAQKRAFKERMSKARKKGIQQEIKMYTISLFLILGFFAILFVLF